MHGFGTFTWKDRREANSLTYQAKLLLRARTESSRATSSWYMKVL